MYTTTLRGTGTPADRRGLLLASIASYEKFGFEIEGTHRSFAFRGGEYVDAYSMAHLRHSPPVP